MGYTTRFSGELLFNNPATPEQLTKLKSFFGEDCRDRPEWESDTTYIDLIFNKDFTGIRWDDETEKNNGMVEHVNLIIDEMKKEFPGFGLNGEFLAQGEDMNDRWKLKIVDGEAVKIDIAPNRNELQCPHCGKLIETEK